MRKVTKVKTFRELLKLHRQVMEVDLDTFRDMERHYWEIAFTHPFDAVNAYRQLVFKKATQLYQARIFDGVVKWWAEWAEDWAERVTITLNPLVDKDGVITGYGED